MHTILSHFGIAFHKERADLAIPGSPERCISRTVLEDNQGVLWLLELLAGTQAAQRDIIARLTAAIAAQGAPFIASFRQTDDRTFTLLVDGKSWQCSPFIQGTELPRPDYIDDAWRGRKIGTFIAGMQQAGAMLPTIPQAGTPDLATYVASLADTLRQREPHIHTRIKPVLQQLIPFFSALPGIPLALAHGDCHPLNIIWGTDDILGVIDWEFAGLKPALYDAANCIGCVGFEHPDWLIRGLIPELITTLGEHGIVNTTTSPWLLPFTCALRFAWLSEWLRRNDREMIDMELDYMDILLRHGQAIQQNWDKLLTR